MLSSATAARSGYANAGAPTRSARDTEYALFAQVTSRMKAVDEKDKRAFVQLADAVRENQRLWGLLADDLSLETNGLPAELRAKLISLSVFIFQHSMVVLRGESSIGVLIDINTAVMRGLRGETEAAA